MGCTCSSTAVESPTELTSGSNPNLPSPNPPRKLQRTFSRMPSMTGPASTKKRRRSIYGAIQTCKYTEAVAPLATCGCNCKAGLKPVVGSDDGVEKTNQDRALAVYPFLNDATLGVFGVFDGHGEDGHGAAEFCVQTLPTELTRRDKQLIAQPADCLKEAFVTVDSEMAKEMDASLSGTTAVVCVIHSRHLYIANAGDSRAIMLRRQGGEKGRSPSPSTDKGSRQPSNNEGGQSNRDHAKSHGGENGSKPASIEDKPTGGKEGSDGKSRQSSTAKDGRGSPATTPLQVTAVDLTKDHKPDTPAEEARVLEMGGSVLPESDDGPCRVLFGEYGLSMARSLGDHIASKVGVIPEPEVTDYELIDMDFCMVIASDGVWEMMDSCDVASLVQQRLEAGENCDAQSISNAITERSVALWKELEGDYRDDISVVVLMLPWLADSRV